MDSHTYLLLCKDCLNALQESRVLDAIIAAEGMLAYVNRWDCSEELGQIRQTYTMLLRFMEQGASDPSRDAQLKQLIRRIYEITDRLQYDFLLRDGKTNFASVRQALLKLPTASSLGMVMNESTDYRTVFEVVWTSDTWKTSDYALMEEAVEAANLSQNRRSLLVSAVTLSCLTIFDNLKLLWLINRVKDMRSPQSLRALVGVVLVCISYAKRIDFYPDTADKIRSLDSIDGFASLFTQLQLQLLLSWESKKAEKKMDEEIIPEIMKRARRMRFDKSATLEDIGAQFVETNPEWADKNGTDPIFSKMQQFAQMQQKGVDLNLSQFKQMYRRLPFFSTTANWFCPFSVDHPALPKDLPGGSMIQALLANNMLCDTDRYSLCLFFASIPNLSALANSGLGDFSMVEKAKISGDEVGGNEPIYILRAYIHDLYRYFKLFPHHNEDADPFRHDLLLVSCSPLSPLFEHDEVLRHLARFCFSEGHYAQALPLLHCLPPTADVLQKEGYCHQMACNYAAAIDAYEEALLFDASSLWTKRQLASCHRALGHEDVALRMYLDVEQQSEDLTLMLTISDMLMQLNRYEDALTHLYKAYYLHPESKQALRALAWCTFLAKKYEESLHHYEKIIGDQPDAGDFLNAGHVAWLSGDIFMAATYYREHIERIGKDAVATNIFQEDEDILIEQGLTPTDLRLMTDLLNIDRQ